MERVYSQQDLAECKVCHTTAVVIVTRRMAQSFVLYSYCEFHAEIAKQYFGNNPNRNELKGGFKLSA